MEDFVKIYGRKFELIKRMCDPTKRKEAFKQMKEEVKRVVKDPKNALWALISKVEYAILANCDTDCEHLQQPTPGCQHGSCKLFGSVLITQGDTMKRGAHCLQHEHNGLIDRPVQPPKPAAEPVDTYEDLFPETF